MNDVQIGNEYTVFIRNKLINGFLNIKIGKFTEENVDDVLKQIKDRKSSHLNEIPPQIWKLRKFDDTLPDNAVYKQNTTEQ